MKKALKRSYHDNLLKQAEDILRSWAKPAKKRRGQKVKTRPSGK